MGDQSIEVSEENRDAAQALKANAMYAISEGMQKTYMFNNFYLRCQM